MKLGRIKKKIGEVTTRGDPEKLGCNLLTIYFCVFFFYQNDIVLIYKKNIINPGDSVKTL